MESIPILFSVCIHVFCLQSIKEQHAQNSQKLWLLDNTNDKKIDEIGPKNRSWKLSQDSN